MRGEKSWRMTVAVLCPNYPKLSSPFYDGGDSMSCAVEGGGKVLARPVSVAPSPQLSALLSPRVATVGGGSEGFDGNQSEGWPGQTMKRLTAADVKGELSFHIQILNNGPIILLFSLITVCGSIIE